MSGFNRIVYLISAASLALIALFVLQVKWMTNSHALIEEQFDQKVRLALCNTIESLNGGKLDCGPNPMSCLPDLSAKDKDSNEGFANASATSCLPVKSSADLFQVSPQNTVDLAKVDSTLSKMLAFYDISLPYELSIYNGRCNPKNKSGGYCCAMDPFETASGELLNIRFPGKNQYILSRLKFMLFSSILILLFITVVFAYAIYALKRQKQIDKINRNFFNSMAHEFRTPLTNISLATRFLAKQKPNPKEAQYLDIVDSESKRLKHQVERALHLAKFENGEYQLEKAPLDVLGLLKEVVEHMNVQIQEKVAKVRLDVQTNDLVVLGDKFHLGNAFRNLLDNALKYSPDNVEITISIQKNQDGILILFQDNGIGISKKDQQLVFKEYKRSKLFSHDNQSGFGLGLAYVKMIVERHNGFIKVISELNKGCRFDLFLPAKSYSP